MWILQQGDNQDLGGIFETKFDPLENDRQLQQPSGQRGADQLLADE